MTGTSKTRKRKRAAILEEIFGPRRGLAKQLALALGLSKQAVYSWRKVPEVHLHRTAELLRISPWRLRPDLKPKGGDGIWNHEAGQASAAGGLLAAGSGWVPVYGPAEQRLLLGDTERWLEGG